MGRGAAASVGGGRGRRGASDEGGGLWGSGTTTAPASSATRRPAPHTPTHLPSDLLSPAMAPWPLAAIWRSSMGAWRFQLSTSVWSEIARGMLPRRTALSLLLISSETKPISCSSSSSRRQRARDVEVVMGGGGRRWRVDAGRQFLHVSACHATLTTANVNTPVTAGREGVGQQSDEYSSEGASHV